MHFSGSHINSSPKITVPSVVTGYAPVTDVVVVVVVLT